MPMIGVPTAFSSSAPSIRVSQPPFGVRVPPLYWPRDASLTASPTPSPSRARRPLAASEMPAPASSSIGARSTSVTCQPMRRRPIAATSPPMPPPTTTAVLPMANPQPFYICRMVTLPEALQV